MAAARKRGPWVRAGIHPILHDGRTLPSGRARQKPDWSSLWSGMSSGG